MAANPIARSILALVLLVGSLGGLSLVAYADNLVNGGISWGPNVPKIPLASVNPLGVNTFLEKEVDSAKVEKSVQMAHDAGFRWVRQGFGWIENWEP